MLISFTSQMLDAAISNHFVDFGFSRESVYFNDQKLSASALAELCSCLWKKLQTLELVVSGKYQLSSECTWYDLHYFDVNCLCRVLLHDYCSIEDSENYLIDAAYNQVRDFAPFKTFVSLRKIDVEVPVAVVTYYSYNGNMYYSHSALWEEIEKQFPESKYNVSLKF